MGRTEPSKGLPPARFRRAARAKLARTTVATTIPALLAADARARRGVEAAELVIDPPPVGTVSGARAAGPGEGPGRRAGKGRKGKRRGRHDGDGAGGDGDEHDGEAGRGSRPEPAPRHAPDDNASQPALQISIRAVDTLTAARRLVLTSAHPHPHPHPHPHASSARRPANVAVHNMASPLRAGGGLLTGATSQEEALCLRTTLLPSLRDAFYRLPELGVVFSPDVLVFREPSPSPSPSPAGTASRGLLLLPRDLPHRERFYVDVLSAAAAPHPDVAGGDHGAGRRYARAADADLARASMRAVLRVAVARRVSALVLGAWGCGAYGHPVAEVARAWRAVLLGDDGDDDDDDDSGSSSSSSRRRRRGRNSAGKKKAAAAAAAAVTQQQPQVVWPGIREVVFAIKDRAMAREFARCWGRDIVLHEGGGGYGDDGPGQADGDDDEKESQEVLELRTKIAELEVHVAQARTSLVRGVQQSTLDGLRRRLAELGVDDADGSVRSRESTTDGSE